MLFCTDWEQRAQGLLSSMSQQTADQRSVHVLFLSSSRLNTSLFFLRARLGSLISLADELTAHHYSFSNLKGQEVKIKSFAHTLSEPQTSSPTKNKPLSLAMCILLTSERKTSLGWITRGRKNIYIMPTNTVCQQIQYANIYSMPIIWFAILRVNA